MPTSASPPPTPFRSALPRGERPADRRRPSRLCSFDPRSRAGSDQLRQPARDRRDVSIRAPARGATRGIRSGRPSSMFRSALPRGERHTRRSSAARSAPMTRLVSIRAPARGATSHARVADRRHGFDPRSRAGSDTIARARSRAARARFDPRSRAGSDPIRAGDITPRASHGFDPRSRAGSDAAKPCGAMPRNRFRSALPRGERHGGHGCV